MTTAIKMANDLNKFRAAGKSLHDIVLAGTRLGIPVSRGLAETCAENYSTAAKDVNNFLDKAEEQFSRQAVNGNSEDTEFESAFGDDDSQKNAPRG